MQLERVIKSVCDENRTYALIQAVINSLLDKNRNALPKCRNVAHMILERIEAKHFLEYDLARAVA